MSRKSVEAGEEEELPLPVFLVLFRVSDFSPCPHVVEGAKELSEVTFIRALDPIHEGSTLMTITSHRSRLLTASQWVLRFQLESWPDTNIQTRIMCHANVSVNDRLRIGQWSHKIIN